MTKRIGLWIDHAQAHVITLSNGAAPEVLTIESDVERRHRSTGNEGPAVPGQLHGSAAKRYEHRREQEMHRFFGEVIEVLASADRLLVMGPGVAKDQFRRAIKRKKSLSAKLEAVEPCDTRLSSAQIVARVREYYDEAPARGIPRHAPLSHTPQELQRGAERGRNGWRPSYDSTDPTPQSAD